MDGNQGDESSLSDDYLNDSFASIGNSTRSLLSPILNEKLYIKTSTPGKERQNSESQESEEEYQQENEEEEDEKSYTPEKSQNMVLTSISLAKRSGKNSFSGTKSSRTGSNYSSSFSSSYLESSRQKVAEKDGHLSPWEKWLIGKTSETREKLMKRKMEESRKKIELEEKEQAEESKRKDIEKKLSEWMETKEETDKIKRDKKRRELEEQRRLKMKEQNEIEEKSKRVYKQWLKEKKVAELEAKKKKEKDDHEKKQKQVEKQMKNEEAFEEWLKKSKKISRSDSQNYSYGQVGLQGCYDWASYPTPSYINPMPWVNPAPKRNRGRPRKKKELQPVSPPLLFRDYEKRTKKNKSAFK